MSQDSADGQNLLFHGYTIWETPLDTVAVIIGPEHLMNLQKRQGSFEMAGLSALPNELLLLIFTSSPSISAAIRLSEVSRSLREVWLENFKHITTAILQAEIPAYDDAVALVEYECGREAAPSQWTPRLLRNADMARNVCVHWEARVQKRPRDTRELLSKLSSIPAAYYTIRQLVNCYNDVQFQARLYPAIVSASRRDTETRHQLGQFMCTFMDDGEMARHGIIKDEHLWTEDEGMLGLGIKDEWEFATDVFAVMCFENNRPGYSSPDLPCPWRFGNPCCGEDCRRGETWPYDTRPGFDKPDWAT